MSQDKFDDLTLASKPCLKENSNEERKDAHSNQAKTMQGLETETAPQQRQHVQGVKMYLLTFG
jgi:hypothetical protein